MPLRRQALAALFILAVASPAGAQDAPPAQDAPAQEAPAVQDNPAPQAAASQGCAAARPRKGPGLGALLSAANRAGVGDMLNGRSGQLFGSGKGGAIAGAVLGTAMNAADPGAEGAVESPPMMSGPFGGSRKAQIAAAATGAAIQLARASAANAAAPCAAN
jgi:hypothetical protein